jgi:hypothetical protein
VIGVIRAELLRARSGRNTLAVLLFIVFVPFIVLTSDDTLDRVASLDADTATALVLAPLAWSFVAAAFAGAFASTREFYYHSMSRTIALTGFRRAFVAKAFAAVAVALVFSVLGVVVWTGAMAVILGVNGLTLTPTPAAAWTVLGAILGALLGAVMGAGIGWIVANYYAGAAITLAGPLAFEMVALASAPDVARFSPGLALAALASPQDRAGLLSPGLGFLIALGWALALTVVAWFVGRRRLR